MKTLADPAETVTRWYSMCSEPAGFAQCESCIRNEANHPGRSFAPYQRWSTPILNHRSRTCHDWMPGTPK